MKRDTFVVIFAVCHCNNYVNKLSEKKKEEKNVVTSSVAAEAQGTGEEVKELQNIQQDSKQL